MKKHAYYSILPDLRLIMECCRGRTSVEEAINMKKEEISDGRYDPGYNIIVNIQEFETDLNSSTSETISVFFNFIKELNIKSRIAFLTTKPHQVVLSEILKGLFKDFSSIEIEIFSTTEAAVRYLGFSADEFNQINNELMKMNKINA